MRAFNRRLYRNMPPRECRFFCPKVGRIAFAGRDVMVPLFFVVPGMYMTDLFLEELRKRFCMRSNKVLTEREDMYVIRQTQSHDWTPYSVSDLPWGAAIRSTEQAERFVSSNGTSFSRRENQFYLRWVKGGCSWDAMSRTILTPLKVH